MARRLTHVPTDESLRETTEHGSSIFPFEYYIDEIMNFVDHEIEWHWHSELEWLYMEKGSLVCCIGEDRILLEEGNGMFINSKVIHHFEARGESVMPNVLFRPSFLAEEETLIYQEWILPVLQSGRSFLLFSKDDTKAQKVMEGLHRLFLCADANERDTLQIRICAAQLWHLFVKEYRLEMTSEVNAGSVLLQSRMRQMMQYIQDHYTERVTLEQIAQAANISKSEALRCFHIQLQKTPVEYLIEYRLSKARQLLLTTNENVSQIAAAVGMENISYFVRSFKSRYGKTPGKYRKA